MSLTLCSGDVKILSKKDVVKLNTGFCLSNESFSFQLFIDDEFFWLSKDNLNGEISVESDLPVNIYKVHEVKGNYSNNKKTDKYYIKSKGDVYPDLLTRENYIYFLRKEDHVTFYFEIPACEKAPGEHIIKIKALGKEVLFKLNVLDKKLLDTDVILTNWFHLDGICNYYKVEPFSKQFYSIFEKFLSAYVKMGNNMLLIPLFTPPLDTGVGKERLTTQLVKVKKNRENFEFDFSEVDKYIEIAKSYGIKYFEFSHLFTQWGGEYCPKIMIDVDGKLVKYFGWSVNSDSKEYCEFLSSFLSELADYTKKKGIFDNCYMHLTDEPHGKHVDKYEQLYHFVKKHNGGMKTMDALSQFDFCKRKIVDMPAVATFSKDLPQFDEVPHLIYYCIGVDNEYLTNRYFHMPFFRTMVLGFDIFTSKANGFLHWGYNFYNTQFSISPLNPYADATTGGAFAAGDSFIVYPGDGDVDYSIRYFAMLKAFELYRLLISASKSTSREKVICVMKKYGFIDMHTYSKDIKKYYKLKEELYELL